MKTVQSAQSAIIMVYLRQTNLISKVAKLYPLIKYFDLGKCKYNIFYLKYYITLIIRSCHV